MIQARNICYHYKGCPEVLKSVGFELEAGSSLPFWETTGLGKARFSSVLTEYSRRIPENFCWMGKTLWG